MMKINSALLITGISLLFGSIGSVNGMQPKDMSLPNYIVWLESQPSMKLMIDLDDKDLINVCTNQELLEQDAALSDSPSYQSFSRYKAARKKLLDGEPYLGEIYPRSVFLQHLSDMLVRYSDSIPKEVSDAFAKNDGSAEMIQNSAEALLKWYWAQDLKDEAIKENLTTNMEKLHTEKLENIAPRLHAAIKAMIEGQKEVDSIIEYYDSGISLKAENELRKYLESYTNDPLSNILTDTDAGGNTALHYLAHQGSVKLFTLLPQQTIEQLLNTQNSLGDTPLHTAIKQGNTEFALYLLQQPGIHFEAENSLKQIPLYLATQKRDYQVGTEILKKKAGTLFASVW